MEGIKKVSEWETKYTTDTRVLKDQLAAQARTLINNAKQIYRHIDLASSSGAISCGITAIDEVKIPPSVPTDMMKTLYDFTEGWAVDDEALQINMMLVHPLAVITPTNYEFAQLDPPSAGSQGKWEYYEESFEDVFLLPNRKSAIAFNVTAASGPEAEPELDPEPTYSAVESPTGNPSTSGYYELVEVEYVFSEDTTVQVGKIYYTLDED